jgi:hypothetical protein
VDIPAIVLGKAVVGKSWVENDMLRTRVVNGTVQASGGSRQLYPGQSRRLASDLDRYLADADVDPVPALCAVVAPQAA